MLSVAFQFVRYFLKTSEANPVLETESACCINQKIDPLNVDNECSIVGTVTKINNIEGYGLVNQQIYFNFDNIHGSEEVKIGDTVEVQASRTDSRHGWKATSVHLLKNDWSSEKTQNTPAASIAETFECSDAVVKTIDGKVTQCNATFGMINNKYRFEFDDCKNYFRPVIGDFLKVSIKNKKIVSWEPKFAGEIEGTVTACEIDSGIINEKIYFFAESCQCYSDISLDLKVLAHVVESEQNSFSLRAFKLTSISKTISKPCLVNQSGLHITNNLDFELTEIGVEKNILITLRNDNILNLAFVCCRLQKEPANSPFFTSDTGSFTEIIPKSHQTLIVSCKAQSLGWHDDLVMFEFDEFIVKRPVTVFVVDPTQNLLNPSRPFAHSKSRRTNRQETADLVVVPGVKPFPLKANFKGFKPGYAVPANLWRIIENKDNIAKGLPGLAMELNVDNYVRKISCLLHLEEIQMSIQMSSFDMFEVVLSQKGEFLSLTVPGLAEGRPSLLMGDRAMLLPPHNKCKVMYEGFIHEVQKDDIFLKFHERFQEVYNGETYDVTFRFSRTNIRRMHESLYVVHRHHNLLLFPKSVNKGRNRYNSLKPCGIRDVNWQNKKLNGQQKEAVCRILNNSSHSLPYVIFGPPGTGKTITVVETVIQLFLRVKNARIIICTPSNSAADLVTQRLVETGLLGQKELVRLNSFQRNVENISEDLKPYCMDKEHLQETASFSIVVSTSATAGAYMDYELPPNHFTHLFIDEAGQLTEPECMMPISLVVKSKKAQIILAGDPKQLGPVLMSNIAKSHGLQISYLERLMENPLYSSQENNGFNPSYVTMLVECYRSHPVILYYPSKTFYLSQVVSSKLNDWNSLLTSWESLPKKGFPIIFNGIRGEESREGNSPSWFNSSEVVKACQYLAELYKIGLTPEEVGIIAPYRKQVEKLRLLSTAFSLECCKIGSVEEFQGQERRAIIITTVRSAKDFVKSDIIHNLGFVSNPKRFNVAVTRAKELLIVIGNPFILSQDPIWDGFIKYCKFNGGYIGCDLFS